MSQVAWKIMKPKPTITIKSMVKPSIYVERVEVKDLIGIAGQVDQKAFPVTLKTETITNNISKVPETRIGRLFELSKLGISLGAGIISSKVRQVARMESQVGDNLLSPKNIEKIVSKLSKMRGAALKLGQMLSIQDNEALSPDLHKVLVKVQNNANYMPDYQRIKILVNELGPDWEINFSGFDSIPIAAASIGQVHAAILKSGEKVAVKIQYPGVSKSIDSDLDNLMMLLNFSNFLPKGLYLDNTVRVARKELQMECDYIREAACMDRFSDLITKYQLTHFKVPKVYKHLSTGQVLITEYVNGYTIDQATALPQKDRDLIGKQLLELCLKELFVFRFMQTDPNFGNFLYNRHTSKINLLDFGAAREYSKSFTDYYLQLLKAGKDQNKESAIEFSIKLGFLSGFESEKMLNAHVNSLFLLAKPFNEAGYYDFGSSKSVTDGVRDDIPVMLNERLKPPPDETYSLHRKLSGCFLLCSKLGSRVDCQAEFNKIFNEYRLQEAD